MTVLDLSAAKARNYFMEPENYGSTELPQYFDFTNILAEARKMATKALQTKDLLQSASAILNKFNHLPNPGYLQMWLQRIAIPNKILLEYSEGLCRRVIDETFPYRECFIYYSSA